MGCGESVPPHDEFIGDWESHSFRLNIRRDGDNYLIDLDNHRGMLSGQYVGELVDGRIKLVLPLAGEQFIRFTGSRDQLHFIGEQMERAQIQDLSNTYREKRARGPS